MEIVTSENKEQSLKEGLEKINQYLPSSVYIPFVSGITLIIVDYIHF